MREVVEVTIAQNSGMIMLVFNDLMDADNYVKISMEAGGEGTEAHIKWKKVEE